VLVAVIGAVPMFKALDSNGEQPSATSTSIPSTAPAVPRDIETIDPRISRVLYAFGAAETVSPGGSAELPDAIVSVLSDRGVTLTIPIGERP
jgi:hypothetical protein